MVEESIVEALGRVRMVPVIRTSSTITAERACDWMIEAGCKALEITFTVPDAVRVIASLRQRVSGVLIGAGTVLDAGGAEQAFDAGAEFLVAPCGVPEVAAAADRLGVALIPGASTPTEVFMRWSEGAPAVKVFPAAQLGGADFIRTLRSVFPAIPLMPTGGVDVETISDYFAAGAFCVGIGGALTPREALENNDKARVVELTQAALGRCQT
jgi:2-dehydro-3-deoxyphosphogluconate aldolase/(4S)-4-hydroxy-2-oxoglutarate aldolase